MVSIRRLTPYSVASVVGRTTKQKEQYIRELDYRIIVPDIDRHHHVKFVINPLTLMHRHMVTLVFLKVAKRMK